MTPKAKALIATTNLLKWWNTAKFKGRHCQKKMNR